MYFLLVAALSLTPFSPVRPWTTWAPLALILGVSLIKEVGGRVCSLLTSITCAGSRGRWLHGWEWPSRPTLTLAGSGAAGSQQAKGAKEPRWLSMAQHGGTGALLVG